MSTVTTRLGMTKQAGGEQIDVDLLNADLDLIDTNIGVLLVNAGVTPPNSSLYDGAVVKEKTTGICWIAQKNGGGGFDKAYLKYPYLAKATASATIASAVRTTLNLGFVAGGYNAVSGDFVGNYWVAPVAGVYTITFIMRFQANASPTVGTRGVGPLFNNAALGETQLTAVNTTGGDIFMYVTYDFIHAVGDTHGVQVIQTSGAAMNVFLNYFHAHLKQDVPR